MSQNQNNKISKSLDQIINDSRSKNDKILITKNTNMTSRGASRGNRTFRGRGLNRGARRGNLNTRNLSNNSYRGGNTFRGRRGNNNIIRGNMSYRGRNLNRRNNALRRRNNYVNDRRLDSPLVPGKNRRYNNFDNYTSNKPNGENYNRRNLAYNNNNKVGYMFNFFPKFF